MAGTSRSSQKRAVLAGSTRTVWPSRISISAAGQENRTTPSITEIRLTVASTCKRTRAPRSSVTCAPGTASVSVSAPPGSPVKYATP